MPQRGPLPKPANVVRNLERLVAIVFELPLASTIASFAALRLEMILRFAKFDAGALEKCRIISLGKSRMAI